MIWLHQDTTNIIGTQAHELATTDDYLFRFFNLQTRVNVVKYFEPLSSNRRITNFEIKLPTDIDLEVGEYIYSIYNGDGVNEDYSELPILEVGKLTVI
jgi:hypothetical protein